MREGQSFEALWAGTSFRPTKGSILKEARASLGQSRSEIWFEEELLPNGMPSAAERSEKQRASLAVEWLMEENSRYSNLEPSAMCFWGGRVSSSSTLSGGKGAVIEMDERCGNDAVKEESEGKLNFTPLRVCPAEVRDDQMGVRVSFMLEEGRGEGVEKEEDEESWRYSCLARFCQCLGMPAEGFEMEILQLLNKIRERRDCSERVTGKKRKGKGLSRFDRELKKLEWSVNYGGIVEDRGHQESGVYGPTAKAEREDFWSELGAIKGLWNEPWCVAGDFNMIRFPSERSRGGRLTQGMRRFSEVVEELELRDLPLQGGCSHGAIQTVLARPISDHALILLDRGGMRRGPTPFRFENMWLKSEGFKEVMRQWWEGIQVNGSASFILTEKLKALKPLLRSWNKEVFGQIDLEKQKAWNLIEYWDKEEMVRSLSIEEEEVRKEARELYKKWALLEEVSWRQKSREIWLKKGDRNTKFFHKMANAYRRRKQLNRIKVNERCFTKESEIKEEVGRNFQELLTNPGDWKPSIKGLNFERLEEREVERLEQPFLEEEVFEALKGCCGEKAPGPDDFSMAFWQFAWDFVKVEVLNLFRQFHETGRFVRSMNATFLVLIPKKGGAEDLKDFRPISLVGGLYKWLAKIMDAVLIANEAIDSILKNNRGAIMCKLDIEKAYDHVDWKFLIAVMAKMGFGGKGGLGVKSLGLFNKALLGKWAWRFANEKTALWNQVIRRKYGEEKGGWRSCEIREAYGVGLWKAINKVGQFVTPFFGYEVGDGKNVRFWKDKWCGTSPLSEAFPSLFSIAKSKEAWVNEVWTAEGDRRGSWTPTFNRPFNDWELEEVGRLLRCLEGKMVRVDEEDRVRWVESKDGVFSVKSLYRAMQPVSSAWFPSKIIWMSYAQPKISFFAWEASWGRVLTLDRLQKRGWALANRVYQLLGEAGTYYGVRFGKNIPWVTAFPFGVISDPQYVGSIMSLLACISWVPFQYILLWLLGYVFIIKLESKEDPATRAKPLT
ncbi:hypothetical protein VitviT2T_014152 [Vitis vinifera]|uniref:Reverse transcriptase zinc-binding domain-containing protein n=1 Tax=Vitis vinifera TaxID=29760 RepID=A0ABY9CLA6_VITVI|nr:hypothetical protein VitviT2T_014152 [Vitis vinifera]